MATEELSASVRGIRGAGLQPRSAVSAGGVRLCVLPPGLGKTVAEKIFEELLWKPEDVVFFPLGCRSRMMD
jgi:hypothetical protein